MTLGQSRRRLVPAVLVLAGLGAAPAAARSDLSRLEKRIRELEDLVYMLEKSRQELEARLARLEGKLYEPAAPAAAGPGAAADEEATAREPVRALPLPSPAAETGHPSLAAPWPASAPLSGPEADAAFGRAKAAYDQERYRQAIPLLQEFVARRPSDPRAIEAQYLIGEAYYAEANFPQAIVELGKSVEADPMGPRAPDGLYKIALAYYELGYRENALEHLERLERSYPGTASAEAARPLLDKLRRRRSRG